jgi:hypothetical protein
VFASLFTSIVAVLSFVSAQVSFSWATAEREKKKSMISAREERMILLLFIRLNQFEFYFEAAKVRKKIYLIDMIGLKVH